jgi:hypothetical protein
MLHEVTLSEITSEGLFAEKKLITFVVFHEASIRHTSIQQLFLQIALSTATFVLHFDKLDLRLG